MGAAVSLVRLQLEGAGYKSPITLVVEIVVGIAVYAALIAAMMPQRVIRMLRHATAGH
jgi:hypothetical protein